MYPETVSPNFLELNAPLREAKAVIIGCPLDETSSFRPGSRFGPRAIRDNSLALETYSPALGTDLEDIQIADIGDLNLPIGRKEKAFAQIRKAAQEVLSNKQLIAALGGEHLVSLPLITESKAVYPDLKVIHLDAHADLRDEYQGEPLSHATIMRRALEVIGKGNLYQLGIRSGTKEEFRLMDESRSLFSLKKSDLSRLKASIASTPCYISLDLDVLDPGIFPATGTPEPGGVYFNDLLDILYYLHDLNVIGFDLVEYNPMLDLTGHCSIIAGKLLREMLLLFADTRK